MKYIFSVLFFLLTFLDSSAQSKAIKVNVTTSFFKTDKEKDEISSIYIDSVLKYYDKVNFLKYNQTYPFDTFKHTQLLTKKYDFLFFAEISDTTNKKGELVLYVKELLFEKDSLGLLYKGEFINNNKDFLSKNCFESAGIILTSYGHISYTKITKFSNFDTSKLIEVQGEFVPLQRLRNVIILLDVSDEIDKKSNDVFKTIIKNLFIDSQKSIYAQSLRRYKPKYVNLFFYDKKIPKKELNEIKSPVIVRIKLDKKDENNLYFHQTIEGRYEKTDSEADTKKYFAIKDFDKYPYTTISNISSDYLIIKDILLHLLEK